MHVNQGDLLYFMIYCVFFSAEQRFTLQWLVCDMSFGPFWDLPLMTGTLIISN